MSLEYSLDGEIWNLYASPVNVTDAGPHEIRVRSTDGLGNDVADGPRAFDVRMPTEAPDDFPWWILLLIAAIVILFFLWWRRRRKSEEVESPSEGAASPEETEERPPEEPGSDPAKPPEERES